MCGRTNTATLRPPALQQRSVHAVNSSAGTRHNSGSEAAPAPF